ncbi:Deoxyribose-phosphate aldolase [Rubrivivax sp. A210]|uniref:deoxyribose-phosphate aldolase n=1 Tax=Rubrivivax sp. A210 TaxID=2772301 RepID=UPI001917B8F3|nr:deoxyribose-phosphate aldolase [Rubrivivax sp. A210]CAD5373284.1 Deoxyribose-phosphate aldolase [Rubrivivax sp. A210]
MSPAPAAAVEATARLALACLDLTSLERGHDAAGGEAEVERLCTRALGPGGAVAAVCVWPRLAGRARALLPAAVRVAAVANFPEGSSDIAGVMREVAQIAQAGAQEVDVVLPWREPEAAPALLAAVRRASTGLTLKVILETGALADAAQVMRACRVALDGGADFLKTSTGKHPVGATPAAARLLLQAIALDAGARGRVGFKPAGGIRRVADAGVYIDLTAEILGAAALTPARLRLGASGLLDDIETVLAGRAPAAASNGY